MHGAHTLNHCKVGLEYLDVQSDTCNPSVLAGLKRPSNSLHWPSVMMAYWSLGKSQHNDSARLTEVGMGQLQDPLQFWGLGLGESGGSYVCALPVYARYIHTPAVFSSYHLLSGSLPPLVSFPLPHSFWFSGDSVSLLLCYFIVYSSSCPLIKHLTATTPATYCLSSDRDQIGLYGQVLTPLWIRIHWSIAYWGANSYGCWRAEEERAEVLKATSLPKVASCAGL